jgi:hypothetical protein
MWSINAKYAEITLIGAEGLLKDIFKNEDMPME